MNNYLIQFILSAGDGSESLIDILIVVFFIVAWVIRNLFLGQKQQSQQQKRPVPHRPAQRTSVSSQKAQAQKDRVEQFLESILQPKKMQQQHPAGAITQKPHINAGIPIPQKAIPIPDQGSANKPAVNINQRIMSQPKDYMNADEALGVSIMDLPTIDTAITSKLEQIPVLKEEHLQEDQQHLIYHNNRRMPSVIKSSGIAAFLSDSDDLKRAILYAEILGKPVSMRESQSIY